MSALHEPRQNRIDGVAPTVCGEVAPGNLQDPSLVGIGDIIQRRCQRQPVGRNLLGPLEVVPQELPAPQRGEIGEDRQAEDGGKGLAEAGNATPECCRPGAQEDRCREHHERKSAGRAAHRQAGVRGRPRLEDLSKRRGRIERMGGGSGEHPDAEQQEQVAPVPEARHGSRQKSEQREGEGKGKRPTRVCVGGLDPGTELVLAVEEPVPQPTEQFGGGCGVGDHLVGLGEPKGGEAVGGLGPEPDGPPDGGCEHEQPDSARCAEGPPPGDRALGDAPCDPEHRAEADEEQRCGVDPTDREGDEGEERRMPPSRRPQRPDRQGEHPRESRPRQQDHGDAGDVVEDVGAEHVGEGCDEDRGAPPADGAEEPAQSKACGQQDRTQPEALHDPVGEAQKVACCEERPDGPEEAEVLVRDRAHCEVRLPHRRSVGEEAPWIERQVGLGVGRHHAPVGEEERQVGQ